jgi:hypothetical protein
MRVLGVLVLATGLAACALAQNAVDRTTFDVRGDRVLMAGIITSRTPVNFVQMLDENPQVTTLVATVMEGSLDDQATIDMGYTVRSRGLDTHLEADSEIYSGAVDLFLAGNRRTMSRGAVIGVHSWVDGFGEGSAYPRGAAEHRLNRRYIADMLGDEAFYWFTLAAAPSDGLHLMTENEIDRYGLLTAPPR